VIEIEDVKRLVLNEGDTLVVRLPPGGDYHAAHDTLKAMFPNNNVLILARSVELEVVEATK
jgi:hypothetical protein